ncbi:M56 family metallopeptidase [Oscillibacter hominis]|uniref:M56 family metallopeptidase n=1 Tax=Oscillibacter hominis TaxID=2763056 RepID=A0A7G9B7X3_9FIRM|nr:M56 family metallopeptidase [Oscillibacter hominis]QNL45654.1 M56 family metallopeptidase [Oscillibacter hominis]
MKEILITSSLLILALLTLRRVFRHKISRRVQYALWLVVALRLLVPVSLPDMGFSALSVTQNVQETVSAQLESRTVYVLPVDRAPAEEYPFSQQVQPGQVVPDGASFGYPVLSRDGQTVTRYADRLTATEVLSLVWKAGILLTGIWFLVGNLLFYRRLRKTRRPFETKEAALPCYLVEDGLSSPCLFGLLRPAVYLTPSACSSEERLRHVLAHETAHYRHGDHIWSLLRCLCLAVYWFNPLVWAAAAASRTDCELACDESALQHLGEAQRIPYGQTLLSLIPVKAVPTGLLRTATTMTSGKHQLKDRIQRIAQKRQTVAAALFAVVVLVAAVCAFTFTGGDAEKPWDPIGEEELHYFNEEYFNGEDYNLRNQFLSSLYDAPEEIDLFELFYCGSGLTEEMTAPELQSVIDVGYGGYPPDTDYTKLSASNMNQVLEDYLGLTLDETRQIGLEQFTYLAEYDAYYCFHGDTNYRGSVTFSSGSRRGDLIRLIYDDWFMGDGYKVLTLRKTGGGYHFVSNQRYLPPPAGELDQVLSLERAAPHPLEAVPTEEHVSDLLEILQSCPIEQGNLEGRTAAFYRAADETIYAALIQSEADLWTAECFLTVEYDATADRLSIRPFSNLLGYDGFVVEYPIAMGTSVTAYYTLDDAGQLQLLFETTGGCSTYDMDLDGQQELLYEPLGAEPEERGLYLLFQGQGELKEAHLDSLLQDAYPNWSYWEFGSFDSGSFLLPLNGYDEQNNWTTSQRFLRFTGGTLESYRDNRSTKDHVMEGIDAAEDVLAAAKEEVEGFYREARDYDREYDPHYDDWRIESLTFTGSYEIHGVPVELYNLNYEFHSSSPESVALAGGMYLKEDGWLCPSYPYCTHLLFLKNDDGSRSYVGARMINDCGPDSDLFWEDFQPLLFESDVFFDPEDAFRAAVMEHVGASLGEGALYAAEAHAVLSIADPGEPLSTYYGVALYQESGYTGGVDLTVLRQCFFPCSVTLEQRGELFYIQDFWAPAGSIVVPSPPSASRPADAEWLPQVEAQFPSDAAKLVRTTMDSYEEGLSLACARETASYWEGAYSSYLGSQSADVVANFLLKISNSPADISFQYDVRAESALNRLFDQYLRTPYDLSISLSGLGEAEQADLVHLLALEAQYNQWQYEARELPAAFPSTSEGRRAEEFYNQVESAIHELDGTETKTVREDTYGLTLAYPAGWDSFGTVRTSAEEGGETVFSLRENGAFQKTGDGLVWTITISPRDEFEAELGTDFSQFVGPAGGVIGTDQTYVYVLSEPTDVQYLEHNFLSRRHYGCLRVCSQTVLEDFLSRNGIDANPQCPLLNCYMAE